MNFSIKKYSLFRQLSHSLGLIALMLLPLSQATAQSSDNLTVQAQDTGLPTTAGTFTMNMREADIRAFIQWVADRTQKNIIVHRGVRGTVSVISSKPVNREQAYELFLTILRMNGFAAVESEGVVQVIPDAEAKSANIPFSGDEANRGEIVTAVIELQYVEANGFLQTLRPLVAPTAHLAAYSATNSLIVADSARSIARTKKIIGLLDQEEGEFDYEIVPLVHASAEDIEKILNSILKMAMPSAATGNGENTPQSQSLNIAVDKRSNSILLTGNVKRRQQIRRLIKKLDTPLNGEGNTSVVYLNYIEAAEIAPILESVGNSLLKETKAEGLKEFSIQSSETNNALVISAPPAVMNSLKSVIQKLDIQRAQVLVEAVVVRVSGDLNLDLGFAAVGAEAYNNLDSYSGSVFGLNQPAGGTPNDALTAFSIAQNSDDISEATALAGTAGFTYGYLEDGNLAGILRLVASRSKSNIMSTPTVVALDNQEASLLVGQNVPFVTGAATSSGSSVTNPFQTIQRQDIGITLKITPRINQSGSITLDLAQTTENVSTRTVSGASDLVTDKTEIKTSALIRDGQILVVGGLMSETDTETRSQVPLLGDIPILGRLFRSKSSSKDKTNLMVFIKPTILKEQLQIEGITADRYAFMREQQLKRALESFIDYDDQPALDEFETFSPQVNPPQS